MARRAEISRRRMSDLATDRKAVLDDRQTVSGLQQSPGQFHGLACVRSVAIGTHFCGQMRSDRRAANAERTAFRKPSSI
jgi:hypothetical protein